MHIIVTIHRNKANYFSVVVRKIFQRFNTFYPYEHVGPTLKSNSHEEGVKDFTT